MMTAKKKKYPGCLAHAVIDMFYSVVADQRQPQWRGGGYSFVAGLKHLTSDHASLSNLENRS